MARDLTRVARLLDQAFEDRPSCSEDRQRLQEIAARVDQGGRQVRRPVDVWGLDALCDALDAVGPAVNAYIAAEGRG